MNLYLNTFPDRRYKVVAHIDAERHCLEGLPCGVVHLGIESFADQPKLAAPQEIAFLIERKETLEEWRDDIDQLSPILERSGIAPSEVLVVSDCYGHKTDVDGRRHPCGPPGSVFHRDWSALQESGFDFSIWDVDQCPLAHSSSSHLLAATSL